tara:strand:+ start:53 stop:514 length:462 start_codon:yes stop_codon:yes gene_type:complete
MNKTQLELLTHEKRELLSQISKRNYLDAKIDINLLVVDDDINFLRFFNQRLNSNTKYKYLANMYTDELSALMNAPTDIPDVIVIDYHLSLSEGYQIGEMMKSVLKHDIPIIYISSDICVMEILNFEHVITKPLNIADFEKKITDIINCRREAA